MEQRDDGDRRALLSRQLDIAWGFAEAYLIGQIDQDLALWEPSSNICTVRRTDRGWVADWPDEENPPIPNVTIAWILWHIEWWWADTAALVLRGTKIPPAEHRWSGGVDGIVAAKHAWDEILSAADLDQALDWHLPTPQPFWFIAAWVNFELTKNLSEINGLISLRANRPDDHPR